MNRRQATRLLRIERERNAIMRASGRAVLAQYAAWQRDMMGLYRREGVIDPTHQARQLMENVARIHRDAAAVALLRGYRRVLLNSGRRELLKPLDERAAAVEMRLPGATAFESAMSFLRRLVGLTEPQAAALSARFGGLAVQSSARLLGHASKIVERGFREVVAQGLSVDKGTKLVNRAIRRAGLSPRRPWAVEREIRNTANLAYSAGRETGRRDPAIRELLHSLTYVTVGDDRVRPSHQVLDGTTRPADDPFWQTNMPPNGYNCRCTEVENFERVALTKPPPEHMALSSERHSDGRPKIVPVDNPKARGTFRVGADPGWGFNPGDVYGGLHAA